MYCRIGIWDSRTSDPFSACRFSLSSSLSLITARLPLPLSLLSILLFCLSKTPSQILLAREVLRYLAVNVSDLAGYRTRIESKTLNWLDGWGMGI